MRSICRDSAMPAMSTVFKWLRENQQFSEQYEIAMEQRAGALFEEMFEIADESSNDTSVDDNGNVRTNTEVVARSRLRVDVRKWALSKMVPKKYGDRLDVGNAEDKPFKVDDAQASVRLAAILAAAQDRKNQAAGE